MAYRLHLGALAVAYGEKVIFQGPLPKNIEVLADEGQLHLTYSQPIQVTVQSDEIFTVRIAAHLGVHYGVVTFAV